MKTIRVLSLVAAFGLVAACGGSDNKTPTRRTVSTDTTATDTTDTTDNTGGNDNTNGGTSTASGVLLIDLSAASATGTVGQTVAITAKVWLDTAKTKPVTDGTMVSFSRVGSNGVLTPGQDDTAKGVASVSLSATAAGPVTVTASLSGVNSNTVNVYWLAPGQTGGTGGGTGGTGTVVHSVGGVSVTLSKTNITVNDDNALSTADEADIYVTVTNELGQAYAGQLVTLGASDGSLSAITGTTNASGTIGPIKYTAGIKAQAVTITATSASKTGTATIDVGPGAPLVINVADPLPAQISVRGSGNESSVVTFQITDKYGNPVSDNTAVSFTLVPALTGVTVSPSSTTTHGGSVSPVVNAGTKSGTVRLVATVPSVNRSVSSGKITIFGGAPSQSRFAMASNVGVLSGYYRNGEIADITVTVTDRYGNPVVPGTAVYVACEAGRCGTNNEFGIATDDTGHASFQVESAFQNLLWDSGVTTSVNFGGNVGINHKWPALGSPRDGWVNIVALTVGESGYDDSNSNGVFDTGDLLTNEFGEPYLDVNNNGSYDDGSATSFIEDFWDYNANGTRDGSTGSYQERSYIWDAHNLVWSGLPAPYAGPQQYVDVNNDGKYDPNVDVFAVGGPAPASGVELNARFPWIPATATINVGFATFITTGTTIDVNFSDENNNPLPKGSSMSASNVGDSIEVKSPPTDFLVYGGDYSTPLAPRFFTVKDKDTSTPQNDTVLFCATVTVGDTGDKFGDCVVGIVY